MVDQALITRAGFLHEGRLLGGHGFWVGLTLHSDAPFQLVGLARSRRLGASGFHVAPAGHATARLAAVAVDAARFGANRAGCHIHAFARREHRTAHVAPALACRAERVALRHAAALVQQLSGAAAFIHVGFNLVGATLKHLAATGFHIGVFELGQQGCQVASIVGLGGVDVLVLALLFQHGEFFAAGGIASLLADFVLFQCALGHLVGHAQLDQLLRVRVAGLVAGGAHVERLGLAPGQAILVDHRAVGHVHLFAGVVLQRSQAFHEVAGVSKAGGHTAADNGHGAKRGRAVAEHGSELDGVDGMAHALGVDA